MHPKKNDLNLLKNAHCISHLCIVQSHNTLTVCGISAAAVLHTSYTSLNGNMVTT